MKLGRRRITGFAAALIAVILAVTPVYASAGQKIKSVKLHVRSLVESGDSLHRDDIVLGEPERGEIGVWVDSEKYSLESARITSGTSRDLSVGQEIKIKAVLSAEGDYLFKSGFGKSDVKISGSAATVTDVSRSRRSLTVTLRLRGLKGEYDAPEDLELKDSSVGRVHWNAPDNGSGWYELILKRGGSTVKRVTETSATSYNFYPYMTKAGSYTVRVRTVPHTEEEKRYGKNSDWAETDSCELEAEEVSDGSGAEWDDAAGAPPLSQGHAGWYMQNGAWRYRYPDGSDRKDGWEKIQEKWYSFDAAGNMRTGWLQTPSGWFYLAGSGEMLTGWQDISDQWYYFSEDANSDSFGVMAANALVERDGKIYFVDQNGRQARGWKQVGDHWSYFDVETGVMARNTVIDTFYVDADGVWLR